MPSNPLTEEQLAELERLSREATAGKWYIVHGGMPGDDGFGIASKMNPGFGVIAESWKCSVDGMRDKIRANGLLIVAMRNTIDALIAEVRQARAREAALKQLHLTSGVVAK